MKHFYLKLVAGISLSALLFGLFAGLSSASSNNLDLKKPVPNLNQSVTVKGITLTVVDYAIDNNKLNVNYTIRTKKNHVDKTGSLIERPDIFIGNKKIYGRVQGYKKINNREYTGFVDANLPVNLPNKFSVKFDTDAILDQAGPWTIQFKVN